MPYPRSRFALVRKLRLSLVHELGARRNILLQTAATWHVWHLDESIGWWVSTFHYRFKANVKLAICVELIPCWLSDINYFFIEKLLSLGCYVFWASSHMSNMINHRQNELTYNEWISCGQKVSNTLFLVCSYNKDYLAADDLCSTRSLCKFKSFFRFHPLGKDKLHRKVFAGKLSHAHLSLINVFLVFSLKPSMFFYLQELFLLSLRVCSA